ncbi:MAG: heparinase II/III family protein, partial [Sedimentisphaerales bacterium]|nr:heparinase II/III family protein [Sedimentisphaerales bacterium]
HPWSQIALSDWLKSGVDSEPVNFLEACQTNGRQFFFDSATIAGLNECYRSEIVSQADEILQNRFRYFFNDYYDLGPGPDWFLNPVTSRRAKSQLHWCDIDLFDPAVGDIKFIWEPSRFAWVYTLVRAYAATGDEKYAEKFWTLFESWLGANQPNMGPNYACGQECAIRLMAMCFALYALSQAHPSTVERKIKLITAVAVHADRIEKNIDFAISTRTNHSLTEAAGLYTAGTLFPEFERSDHWLKLGKEVLTNEGLKQIYSDGSYTQHSMNYHRFMLQDFLWVLRLAQLNGDFFDEAIVSRLKKAADFLYQMQDEFSGRVPNYGANDGALIIPLNSCDYLDYRPVLQAVNYLFNKSRLYESGPWDEDLVWLFGPQALAAPSGQVERSSRAYEAGGYYTLRSNESWAMMRCHSYKDRPAHADMLHLDLWWKGFNILRDSGSYMYNCEQPWQDYFSSTSAHNTIAIAGASQMQKLSRFTWLDWTKAKLTMHESFNGGAIKIMQGEHYGFRKPYNVIHRRAVMTSLDGFWLIVDDILGEGAYEVGVYWQLGNVDYQRQRNTVILQTASGPACLVFLSSSEGGKCECFRGNDKPAGWQSLYYGCREPAPVFVCSARAQLPARFITLVGLGDTIKNAALDGTEKLSWFSEVSRLKHIVALNSIENSDRNTFVFTHQDSGKIFLC